MQILLDENNNIVSIVKTGSVINGIDVESIPQYVINNMSKYKYINGEFVVRDDYADRLVLRVRDAKIAQLSRECSNVIYEGADILLSNGNTEHFTLTEQDQLNLSGIGLKIAMGATTIAWHQDDVTEPCRYYSSADAMTIIGSLTVFKEYHITYYRDLRIYINSLSNVESINNIAYGTPIPEEYKSQVLRDYESELMGNGEG